MGNKHIKNTQYHLVIEEIQVKITKGYHYLSIRTVKTKDCPYQLLVKMYTVTGAPIPCWKNANGTTTLENSLAVSEKVTHTPTT